jgi:hypothetical protein
LAILEQTAIAKMAEETCIRIKNNPDSFWRCVTVTHGAPGFAILDWRFSIQAQCPNSSVTALLQGTCGEN